MSWSAWASGAGENSRSASECLREFQKGEKTVHGNWRGWLIGAYRLEIISDPKDFKKFPEKKKDPQRFAKKSSKPLKVIMATMESLVTGFTYVPHGHMTIHRDNSLQSIIHLIHMYRRNVFLSTRLLFILTVMFEPSLITGLASTTESHSVSIMCSTLARN